MWVIGHSKSLKLVQFESLSAVSYSPSVTNGGVKSAQTPPCDILFFPVCLESPENQVTQTPFRIKEKFNIQNLTKDFLN